MYGTVLLRSCQGIAEWFDSIQAAVAEKKRENTIWSGCDSIDQWLLTRRNITGMGLWGGRQNNYIDCKGIGSSGVNKAKFITRAIKEQASNSDGTFNMLRPERPESLPKCRGINRLSSK